MLSLFPFLCNVKVHNALILPLKGDAIQSHITIHLLVPYVKSNGNHRIIQKSHTGSVHIIILVPLKIAGTIVTS